MALILLNIGAIEIGTIDITSAIGTTVVCYQWHQWSQYYSGTNINKVISLQTCRGGGHQACTEHKPSGRGIGGGGGVCE